MVLWKCHAGCRQDDVTEALRRLGAIPQKSPGGPPPNGWKPDRRRRKKRSGDPEVRQHRGGVPDKIWNAAAVLEDGPGVDYLAGRGMRAWRPHPEVRWIWRAEAAKAGLRPKMPGDRAVGCIVYRFAAPGDDRGVAAACQIEAVRGDGRRVPFPPDDTKRMSVKTSDFGGGARVFTARPAAGGRGAWLCEGPMDALALLELEKAGRLKLHGAAVLGAAGSGAFNLEAVPDGAYGSPIRVAADNDDAGNLARERIEEEHRRHGIPLNRLKPAAPPRHVNDWTDVLEEADRLKRRGR